MLNVKNLPDALYRKLRARAKREQEVTILLSQALEPPTGRSILELRGLGKELWRGVDAASHNCERAGGLALIDDALLAAPTPLAFWRKKRDKTQAQLAVQIGVSQNFLSHFERGKAKGDVRLYTKLARSLKLSIDDLAPESE
jgi:DNA-binding XRE family transcriptional regulator